MGRRPLKDRVKMPLNQAQNHQQVQRSPKWGLNTMSSTVACGDNWDAAYTICATSPASMIRCGSTPLPAQESVKVAPGYTAVTFIPYGFISSRRFFENPARANLLIL